jgi:hypothetical protein
VFEWSLDTYLAGNERFIVGSPDDGHYRYFFSTGSLSGDLIAGHNYLFESEAAISDLVPNGPVPWRRETGIFCADSKVPEFNAADTEFLP